MKKATSVDDLVGGVGFDDCMQGASSVPLVVLSSGGVLQGRMRVNAWRVSKGHAIRPYGLNNKMPLLNISN